MNNLKFSLHNKEKNNMIHMILKTEVTKIYFVISILLYT